MIWFSGMAANKFLTKSCCGYKADCMGTSRDCIIIPGLSTNGGKLLKASHFCGQAGLGSEDAKDITKNTDADRKTLCSKYKLHVRLPSSN